MPSLIFLIHICDIHLHKHTIYLSHSSRQTHILLNFSNKITFIKTFTLWFSISTQRLVFHTTVVQKTCFLLLSFPPIQLHVFDPDYCMCSTHTTTCVPPTQLHVFHPHNCICSTHNYMCSTHTTTCFPPTQLHVFHPYNCMCSIQLTFWLLALTPT